MRFIPAAVTPIAMQDILLSVVHHLRGIGLSAFEVNLAEYFCASAAYTFSSLMRTNYACFVALQQEASRKKVILPRYSCPSFAHAAIAAGLEVQYCDVDPESLSYDIIRLKGMDMTNTLAIVCANLFGYTNPIEEILQICRKKGVFVIEGVDYGIGTEYMNKRIGTFGDATILNFQEGKAIPVGGGAIVTSNEKIIGFFRGRRKALLPNILTMFGYCVFSRPAFYALFMWLTHAFEVNRKRFSMEDTIRNTTTETDFRFDSKEFDRSLSNFQGALGCRVLSRLEKDMSRRNQNVLALKRDLETITGIRLIDKAPGLQIIHYIRFPVLVGDNKRDELLKNLLDARVEASPMYIEHGMAPDKDAFPGAFRVAKELLTIPCHPFVRPSDIKKTIAIIKSTMRR